MESIIDTFHIDLKTILAQLVNFGVVFVVLYFFAFKPLARILKDREHKISQGLSDAKSNSVLLEKTKQEYDAALIAARAQAQKIFEEGKKEAEEKRLQMLSDAKNEVATIIENGKKSLASEKTKMLTEAKNEVALLAVKAAEKILGRNPDKGLSPEDFKKISL